MAGPLSFDTAYRALKRERLAPVYYMTGDEDLLKEELIELVVNRAVDEGSRDFNLDVRDAAEINGEGFHALVETPPMLADRRVVVIKNTQQWRKNSKVWEVVHRYLDRPAPTTVLVLVQGAPPREEQRTDRDQPNRDVSRASVHVNVEPLNDERLQRWIRVRANRAGFEVTNEAAEHLASSVGSDLSCLAMEIDKLATVAQPDHAVDAGQVAQLVGVRRGETPLDWVRAVLSRDVPKAVDMLGPVLAGARMTGVRLIMSLGTAFVGAQLARALLDGGMPARGVERKLLSTISKPRRLFYLKDQTALWVRAAERWTTAEITDALLSLYQCDCALKSTTLSDEEGIITGMLLSLSPTEVAA
jgi:DNA polymerase-3 subunit delta